MDSLTALDNISSTYTCNKPQDNFMRKLVVETFKPFLNNKDKGLELGCSDGFMTEFLAKELECLEVVEGSKNFINLAKKRNLKNITFHHCLFEEFINNNSSAKFDKIFASYILTHVEDDYNLLNKLKSLLAANGLLFIVVPNSHVLSRQLALHMGLIEDLSSLTENDYNHGHKRTYNYQRLNRVIEKSGLKIISQGGLLLKPLADFQMDQLIENKVISNQYMKALIKMGAEFPSLCSALYAICSSK